MSKTKAHFEIEKSQSVIRTRVLEIRALGEDKLTDALRTERSELDAKFAEGEVKFRASLDALQIEQAKGITTVDTEATELRQLEVRASESGLGAIAAGRPERPRLRRGSARASTAFPHERKSSSVVDAAVPDGGRSYRRNHLRPW